MPDFFALLAELLVFYFVFYIKKPSGKAFPTALTVDPQESYCFFGMRARTAITTAAITATVITIPIQPIPPPVLSAAFVVEGLVDGAAEVTGAFVKDSFAVSVTGLVTVSETLGMRVTSDVSSPPVAPPISVSGMLVSGIVIPPSSRVVSAEQSINADGKTEKTKASINATVKNFFFGVIASSVFFLRHII
jgi:hypothetical protein